MCLVGGVQSTRAAWGGTVSTHGEVTPPRSPARKGVQRATSQASSCREGGGGSPQGGRLASERTGSSSFQRGEEVAL